MQSAMSLDTWGGGLPTAAEAADGEAWLWRVMQSEKNKAMIARLEDSLRAFVHDAEQEFLPFPPRNAFHRKVCYLVARRYGLAHRLEEDPAPTSVPAGPAVRLVLIKTPHSAEPADRLAQLADRPAPDAARDVAAKIQPNSVQNAAEEDDQPEQGRPAASSTTFLRRPRPAGGKATRVPRALATSCTQSSATTLKSISEEDYRKARARIFKNSGVEPDGLEQQEQEIVVANDSTKVTNNDSTRVVSLGVIAKGPVEGSTGFDRRRNRRNAASQAVLCAGVDRPQNGTAVDKIETPLPTAPTGPSKNQGRPSQTQGKASRDSRVVQGRISRQSSSNSLSGNATGSNGGFVQPVMNNTRRSAAYSGPEHSQSDLQDPDFDRRYDKWAARPAPQPHPSQQIPVPIFSQLLYPYAVQASAPHMHPSALHLSPVNAQGGQVQQANVNQYQSVHLHHSPSGSVMFQHIGQGIGGLAAEYADRNMAVSDHVSRYDVPTVDQLGASHSREMSSLQHQGMPAQIARKQSPAYGLDSTADFPPLP